MKVGEVTPKKLPRNHSIPKDQPDKRLEHRLALEESLGIKVSATPKHPRRGAIKGKSARWNPTELTPLMMHIQDIQFFNPMATAKEISKLVKLSAGRVREIMASDMYRTKYRLRKLDLEQMENSKIVEQKEKFRKLRDDMIKAHQAVLDLDPLTHKTCKEIELRKLQQKSVSDLLRMSTEELREIDRRLDNPGGGNGDAIGIEMEVDNTNPEQAYMRLVAGFRKGTK